MPEAVFVVRDDIIVDYASLPDELMKQLGIETADAQMAEALEGWIWRERVITLPQSNIGVWTPCVAAQSKGVVRPEHAIALVRDHLVCNGDLDAFAAYAATHLDDRPLVGACMWFIHFGRKYVPVYEPNNGSSRTHLVQTGKPLPSNCVVLGFKQVTIRVAKHHGPDQLHLETVH